MRILTFFISFCFFLSGYGSDFSFAAKGPHSDNIVTCSFQENQSQQFKTKEQTFNVFEYTDIELEEDYHNEDNVDCHTPVVPLYNWLSNWHDFTIIPVSDCHHNNNPTNVALGLLSSPIYLKNSVFRI
nr:hypothetical protein [uncultured Flavobacterium sp.]